MRRWDRCFARNRRDPELPQDHRQHQHPFNHGKPGAGANPGTRRKRHVRAALAAFAIFCLPATGIKAIWIAPQAFVTVQVPRAENNLRAFGDLSVAKGLGLCRLAHHHRHRRIEPQRLAEHIPADFQAGHSSKLAQIGAPGLFCHGVLPVRRAGQKVKRPGQGRGAGFVACEEKDRDLIHHFVS